MTPRPIAYNLLRLVMAASHAAPRGIDRIDRGYLSYLLDHWDAEVVGVMPTLMGPRFFSRDQLLKARDRLDNLWRERIDPEGDRVLTRLIRRFNDPSEPDPIAQPRGFLPNASGAARVANLVFGGGVSWGKPIEDLPPNALYLDIGHYGITVPRAFRWRHKRPDVRTVFMVHDTIPLEHPEFVVEKAVRAHQRLMMKAAKYADALIVPTQSAASSLRQAFVLHRARSVNIYPLPLPIDDLFSRRVTPVEALKDRPYFLICGVVEPRKNHQLLIEVWRALVRRHGEEAPKLIVAGSPGVESRNIIAEMVDDPLMSRHILLASGLSSPAMARLMAGARAVLMPSFIEGFGLPPVEALSVGTPVLVSDIPAHREAVGVFGEFLPAGNAEPWVLAIEAMMDDIYFGHRRSAVRDFRPRRWNDYMQSVASVFLKESVAA